MTRVYQEFHDILLKGVKGVHVPDEVADLAYERVETADRAVREAFAADTADRNCRQNAMLVGPRNAWLRRMLSKYA